MRWREGRVEGENVSGEFSWAASASVVVVEGRV